MRCVRGGWCGLNSLLSRLSLPPQWLAENTEEDYGTRRNSAGHLKNASTGTRSHWVHYFRDGGGQKVAERERERDTEKDTERERGRKRERERKDCDLISQHLAWNKVERIVLPGSITAPVQWLRPPCVLPPWFPGPAEQRAVGCGLSKKEKTNKIPFFSCQSGPQDATSLRQKTFLIKLFTDFRLHLGARSYPLWMVRWWWKLRLFLTQHLKPGRCVTDLNREDPIVRFTLPPDKGENALTLIKLHWLREAAWPWPIQSHTILNNIKTSQSEPFVYSTKVCCRLCFVLYFVSFFLWPKVKDTDIKDKCFELPSMRP